MYLNVSAEISLSYFILGIEPEAGPSEIKKAYYIKARENHPDRNLNNASANANFQKIGQVQMNFVGKLSVISFDQPTLKFFTYYICDRS